MAEPWDEETRERGLMNTAVLGATSEMVMELRDKIITRAVNLYRASKRSNEEIAASVAIGFMAELTALDDFISACTYARDEGYRATERMHNNGR